MNSTTGKRICSAAVILLAAAAVFSDSAETLLYKDDFESVVPGRSPLKWGRAWGAQGKDLFYVSSECSAAGNNSLMFQRLDSPGQWGAGIRLPSPKKGIQKIEFKFFLDGPADQTCISFEIRDAKQGGLRLLSTSMKRQVLSTYSPAKTNKKKKKGDGTLGRISNDRWYQLSFSLPLTPEDGEYALCELTDLATGKRTSIEILFRHPNDGLGSLYLNFPPYTKNYRVFLDDFRVTLKNK